MLIRTRILFRYSNLVGRPLQQNFRIKHNTPLISRAFSVQSSSAKDIVRELYVKEIKGYKPSPEKPGAELGMVKELRLPTPFQPPNLDEDISAELAEYEADDSQSEEAAAEFETSLEDQFLKDERYDAHPPAH
ncbi:2734_t:CDS:2 [Diversispora eburnea]|uniref:2734_t:CDS:1 n=1 Tax=Diversispora eburnea TaxID=1213867 RepID=A0A9N9F2P5_9GLOM|nr:2734_t:CDS:2 [Diversispora eburnea]